MPRIDYNAPFTLTFCLLATACYAADQFFGDFTSEFLTLYPEFHWNQFQSWMRPLTYALGHAGTEHLFANISFLLLLGPALEERYGTRRMVLWSLVTTFVTALVFILFYRLAILGASGIVFMFIMLSSFAGARKNHIPLSFILVMILFLGKEFLDSFRNDQISQTAHLIGGLTGSLLGLRNK